MWDAYLKTQQCLYLALAMAGLTSCETQQTKRVTTTPPPLVYETATMIAEDTLTQSDYIAAGFAPPGLSHNNTALGAKKSCSFSSFHRKDTIAYEIDPQQRLAFRFSPDIDIFDLDDIDAKFSLRYTRSLGQAPSKRPCTFGSGYYGLVPYIRNNPGFIGNLTDMDNIKSMVEDKFK